MTFLPLRGEVQVTEDMSRREELNNSSSLLSGKHLCELSPGGAKGPQVQGHLLWALKIWGSAGQPSFPTGHRE